MKKSVESERPVGQKTLRIRRPVLYSPRHAGVPQRIRRLQSLEVAERFHTLNVLPWKGETHCHPVAAGRTGQARLGGQETKDELGGIAYFGPGAERGARSNCSACFGAQRVRSSAALAVPRRTSFLPIFRGANGKTRMRRLLRT